MAEIDILGINERNLGFIRPYNKRSAVRLADDKLATKKLLMRTGIPTPKLYGVVKNVKDLEEFNWDKLPAKFVVKPNRGFGGEGIIILRRTLKKEKFLKLSLEEREWITSSGEIWTFERLKSHILDILDGSFSIEGLPDTALIERRLTAHPVFKSYARMGIPDIRVIVFNKVPVMAMLRLPTEMSKGRANIVQGAVGVGVDVGSGVTTTAMLKVPRHKIVERHPDTEQELSGLPIPFWDKILEMSIEAQIASGLGFMGADVALDKRYGPEILEINARAGLDIQVANLEGLAGRLKRVQGLKVKSVSHGVRIAKDLFGGDVERRVEEISGLEVVGIIEEVLILNKAGTKRVKVKAKIDSGAGITAIDRDLAVKLGFRDAVKHYENFGLKEVLTREEVEELSKKKIWKEIKKHKDVVGVAKVFSAHGASYRMMVPLVYYLAGHKVVSKASVVVRGILEYPVIIGRRDLKNFLIDPKKGLPKKKVIL
jgi:alpha-L-glutamate ligase-like protein